MNEQELNLQQQRINDELSYINMRKIVTTMHCPICGHPLRGYVTEPVHDTMDVTPVIYCKTGCRLLHHEGRTASMYARQPNGDRVTKASILETAIPIVRLWVKHFGSPLEEDY